LSNKRPVGNGKPRRVSKLRKVRLLEDEAVWTDVRLASVNVGNTRKPQRLRFNGYQYCTDGECHLARLLHAHGVSFTPDVNFVLELPDGKPRRFVPDFIFNRRAWLWVDSCRRVELIHGFEVKGKANRDDFSERARQNVRLLWEQRGINVKLISDARALILFKCWCKRPYRRVLPMFPLDLRQI